MPAGYRFRDRWIFRIEQHNIRFIVVQGLFLADMNQVWII